ncbi:hypothetical protein BKA65DRAFT_475304 [Rhexocercosporidium sp. MPI-PUGE-AT-0058]|nr:hypothetical protein BKA65DRAFT_475304 [Rhexocercosporidium sp. MPI-PUGE-AT-0058]
MAIQLLPSSTWSNVGPLTSIFTPPASCNYLTISTEAPLATATVSASRLPHLVFYDPTLAPACFPSLFPKPTTTILNSIQTITYGPTATPYSSTTMTFTSWLPQISAYFYPARCPDGWDVRLMSTVSSIPANHTMAYCCPTLPASPNLHKRGGGGGGRGHKARPTSDCGFEIPTKTKTTTAVQTSYGEYDVATIYEPVTAMASGSLTTLPVKDWFASAGGSSTGRIVRATGIVVMWETGYFPDLDETMAASAAAASASASAAAHPASKSSFSSGPGPGLLGAFLGVSLAFAFVGWKWWRGKLRGKLGYTPPDRFLLWLRRTVGSKRAVGGPTRTGLWIEKKLGWKLGRTAAVEGERADVVIVDEVGNREEANRVKGTGLASWFARWMKRKSNSDAGELQARRSEEGLLVPDTKAGGSSKNTSDAGNHDTQDIPTITMDERPPPPYVASDRPAGPSTAPSAGPSTTPPPTFTTTTNITTNITMAAVFINTSASPREWNESSSEYVQRRQDEERAQRLETMKNAREERRARERDGTP